MNLIRSGAAADGKVRCIYVYVSIYVCMYVCMTTLPSQVRCMYVCIYLFMYVCMYDRQPYQVNLTRTGAAADGIYVCVSIHVCMYV